MQSPVHGDGMPCGHPAPRASCMSHLMGGVQEEKAAE